MRSKSNRAAAMSGIVLSIAFAMPTTLLVACGGEDDPIGDATTSPDGPVQLDGGIDAPVDAPSVDLCAATEPNAYQLRGRWTCGEAQLVNDFTSWTTVNGVTWDAQVVVEPYPEMCAVTIPGHMDVPMNYGAFHVERASMVGPFRFYYSLPGSSTHQFVCYDPTTIPSGSAQ